MKKSILYFFLFIFGFACSGSINSEEIQQQNFVFNTILLIDRDNTAYNSVTTKNVKVYDEKNKLIGFENDRVFSNIITIQNTASNGTNWDNDYFVVVFEVELTDDISNNLYLKINDAELDQDDITRMLEDKCKIIRYGYPNESNEYKDLISEIIDTYCSN